MPSRERHRAAPPPPPAARPAAPSCSASERSSSRAFRRPGARDQTEGGGGASTGRSAPPKIEADPMKKLLRIGGLLIAVSIALGVLLRVLLVPSAPSGDGPAAEADEPESSIDAAGDDRRLRRRRPPRRRPRRRPKPGLRAPRPPRSISSRGFPSSTPEG